MLMIVSVSGKHMQKRIIFNPRSKKTRYIALVVGVILIVGGYLVWQKIHHASSTHGGSSNISHQPDSDVAIDAKVRALMAQHDVDGVLAYYDAQAALITADPARLQTIRMNQSLRAVDVKRYDAALIAAKQADAALSSSTTLGQIAQVYEAKGDKKNAIAFYTKARDAVPVVKAGRFNRSQQYDAAIARLSQ